jgi:hypothetical protein
MIALPMFQKYIENSHNDAARSFLQQLALAETSYQTEGAAQGGTAEYLLTGEKADAGAMTQLASFGLRLDPNVAFVILEPDDSDAGRPTGFVAYAAHRAAGSQVYIYDNINGSGVAAYDPAQAAAPAAEMRGNALFLYQIKAVKDGEATIAAAASPASVTFAAATGKVSADAGN